MENAVEALKIAFAVMMFVMALSLSISSLSQASSVVDAIITLNDRETEYTYVEPSSDFSRIVGVETVVPTMYRAYQESFEIYFYKSNGEPLILYYETDSNGERKLDDTGRFIGINYIDGSEVFANAQRAVEHLDQILGEKPHGSTGKLNGVYSDGLYEYLSGKKFKEQLGEYYLTESENTPDVNKVKKRVITYTIID